MKLHIVPLNIVLIKNIRHSAFNIGLYGLYANKHVPFYIKFEDLLETSILIKRAFNPNLNK